MKRFRRAVQLAALAASCTVVLSCTADDQPAGKDAPLDTLPSDAVGVVSVGPIQPPIISERDRTTVFAFDRDGQVLGRVQGGAIYDNQILPAGQSIVTTASDAVTTLTPAGRTSTGIDEDMVQAATSDPASGRAAVWFNSGTIDGRDANRFVSLDTEGRAVTGTLPGMALAAGYCAHRLFVIAEDRQATPANASYGSVLYEVTSTGAVVRVGAWDYPGGLRPATRGMQCSPDGTTLSAPYASQQARSTETGDPGLTLVRIGIADGARTETNLHMPGHTWRIARGSLTAAHDRLYWSTIYGDILSVPATGSTTVTHHWRLPASHLRTKIKLTPSTVAQIDYRATPTYTVFDLATGKPQLGPIPLPWLQPHVDAVTESGETTYTITDLATVR